MATNDMVKIDKTHAYKRVGNNSDVQTLNGIITHLPLIKTNKSLQNVKEVGNPTEVPYRAILELFPTLLILKFYQL